MNEENNASAGRTWCVMHFCRNAWAFDIAMIEESLVLLPVTVLEAVIGIFAGYRLGLKENRRIPEQERLYLPVLM